MSTVEKVWRLVVKDGMADGSGDLVITSLRGHGKPFLASPPEGEGQSVDLLTSEVTDGAYTVDVVDALISTGDATPDRVWTRELAALDAAAVARPHLLSKRASIAWAHRADCVDGAFPVFDILIHTIVTGYVTAHRLTGALRWTVTVGDARRTERDRQFFVHVEPPFDNGSRIIGGPVRDGFGGVVPDGGLVRFTVKNLNTGFVFVGQPFTEQAVDANGDPVGAPVGQPLVTLEFYAGKLPPYFATTFLSVNSTERNFINGIAQGYFIWDPRILTLDYTASHFYGWFPGLTLRMVPAGGVMGGADTVTAQPIAAKEPMNFLGATEDGYPPPYDDQLRMLIDAGGQIYVAWPLDVALPPVGAYYDVEVGDYTPSEKAPVHVEAHPLDAWQAAQEAAGNTVTGVDECRIAIGFDLIYRGRPTAPMSLADYEAQLGGFFGFAVRRNPDGSRQPVPTRVRPPQPVQTITAPLVRGTGVAYDIAESTVVKSVAFSIQRFRRATTRDPQPVPMDLVLTNPFTVTGAAADTSTYGTIDQEYTIEGDVTYDVPYLPGAFDIKQYARDAGGVIMDRHGRGLVGLELPCLDGVIAQVLDEVVVDLPHIPRSDGSAVPITQRGGPVVCIVVSRTEEPAGPMLRLVVAGALSQDVRLPSISCELALGACGGFWREDYTGHAEGDTAAMVATYDAEPEGTLGWAFAMNPFGPDVKAELDTAVRFCDHQTLKSIHATGYFGGASYEGYFGPYEAYDEGPQEPHYAASWYRLQFKTDGGVLTADDANLILVSYTGDAAVAVSLRLDGGRLVIRRSGETYGAGSVDLDVGPASRLTAAADADGWVDVIARSTPEAVPPDHVGPLGQVVTFWIGPWNGTRVALGTVAQGPLATTLDTAPTTLYAYYAKFWHENALYAGTSWIASVQVIDGALCPDPFLLGAAPDAPAAVPVAADFGAGPVAPTADFGAGAVPITSTFTAS